MKKAIILCFALSCAIAFDLMTDTVPVASGIIYIVNNNIGIFAWKIKTVYGKNKFRIGTTFQRDYETIWFQKD